MPHRNFNKSGSLFGGSYKTRLYSIWGYTREPLFLETAKSPALPGRTLRLFLSRSRGAIRQLHGADPSVAFKDKHASISVVEGHGACKPAQVGQASNTNRATVREYQNPQERSEVFLQKWLDLPRVIQS